jgi:hypothetical protein
MGGMEYTIYLFTDRLVVKYYACFKSNFKIHQDRSIKLHQINPPDRPAGGVQTG